MRCASFYKKVEKEGLFCGLVTQNKEREIKNFISFVKRVSKEEDVPEEKVYEIVSYCAYNDANVAELDEKSLKKVVNVVGKSAKQYIKDINSYNGSIEEHFGYVSETQQRNGPKQLQYRITAKDILKVLHISEGKSKPVTLYKTDPRLRLARTIRRGDGSNWSEIHKLSDKLVVFEMADTKDEAIGLILKWAEERYEIERSAKLGGL